MVPVRVFAPFALGYFLSYLFRAINAVAGPGISAELSLDAASLGFLTSVYFLTFAAIQLPLGVLLDRYAPNRVEAVLLAIAGIGALVFARAESLGMLSLGRALIGLGVSACLMAAFRAYALLVPLDRLPLINGLHLAVGGLGLLFGGLPSEMAVGAIGWRGLFEVLAVVAFLEAVALWVLAGTPLPPRSGDSLGAQFAAIGRIFADRSFAILAPASTAAQMTALAVQTLWVGPWLRDVAGFSPTAAATILSAMAACTTVGYALSGTVASMMAARGVALHKVAAGGMWIFLLTQPAILLLPPAGAVAAWLVYALLAGASMLTYSALTAAFPPALAGRVNTALNFVVFVAAFAMQWAVGVMVARLTAGLGPAGAYAVAFSVPSAVLFAALVWYHGRRHLLPGGTA